MLTNFELKQLKPKLDIVKKPENRVHELTDSNVSLATQRRATPRKNKHGSTLKEKLEFLSGTMDFHKPNGAGLNRHNSSRTSLKISLEMTKENFISIA